MQVTLVAHDIRSTHNVGAFFRTCDGLGVNQIVFSGYTPYPSFEGDTRMPHFADKLTRQIHKTALGAEETVNFLVMPTLDEVIAYFKSRNFILVALEQSTSSLPPEQCRRKIVQTSKDAQAALFLGNEIHGVKQDILKQMDLVMEIPMKGKKESLNVSVAAAIALYELTK